MGTRKPGAAASRMAQVSGATPSPAPAPPFAPEVDGDHPFRGTEHDATPVVAPAPSAPTQPRPVRMTVVLQPVEYDRLQDFTHDAQRATGRRGVAASELVRFALDRVLGDEALRRELVERVGREGGNRRREGGRRTRS